jgi:hypothetical protein
VRDAFGRLGQTVPQAPQLPTAVRVSTSQPSLAIALQSAKPGLQEKPHAPAVHRGVEFGSDGQALPQAPQWATVVAVDVSHPSVAVPLLSPNPALQTKPHVPTRHARVELGLAGHTFPHVPHWSGLLPVLTSQPFAEAPSQSENPAAHTHAQSRPEHVDTAPAGGAHSQPFPGVPSQSA